MASDAIGVRSGCCLPQGNHGRGETRPAQAPTPRQAEAIYDERFSVEHAIRFGKQELGLVSGQFNGLAAEGREQTWVELVATVYRPAVGAACGSR